MQRNHFAWFAFSNPLSPKWNMYVCLHIYGISNIQPSMAFTLAEEGESANFLKSWCRAFLMFG